MVVIGLTRLHSDKKGKSHSVRPTSKRVPSWVTYSQDEVIALIVGFGKEGLSPSEIGLRLRDEYSIPLAKPILGKSVASVLRENKLLQPVPEDLSRLLQRAKALQEHLRRNKGDRKNVRSLELQEAKRHRLTKHYKSAGLLSLAGNIQLKSHNWHKDRRQCDGEA